MKQSYVRKERNVMTNHVVYLRVDDWNDINENESVMLVEGVSSDDIPKAAWSAFVLSLLLVLIGCVIVRYIRRFVRGGGANGSGATCV